MKKSKFAIVIALGLVLCLLCGVTTTFSWFSRPRTESGDSLRWSGQYKISNGQNISIKTVESSDDGSTFGENAVTNFGGSLEAGKRRYFCTEISIPLIINHKYSPACIPHQICYILFNRDFLPYSLIYPMKCQYSFMKSVVCMDYDFLLFWLSHVEK